jgi:uncharacterized membrane protein
MFTESSSESFLITTKKSVKYLTPVLVVIGLILNGLSLAVFTKPSMRKFTFSITNTCLAITDIFILTGPVLINWLDENFFAYYLTDNTLWCDLHGYVDLVLCATNSWTIIIISTERFYAVCRPWQMSTLFSHKNIKQMIACVILCAFIFFSFFPLSVNRQKIVDDQHHNTNLYNKSNSTVFQSEFGEFIPYTCQVKFKKIYEILGSLSVLIVYVIPLIILIILNTLIIYRLKKRPKFNKPNNTYGN